MKWSLFECNMGPPKLIDKGLPGSLEYCVQAPQRPHVYLTMFLWRATLCRLNPKALQGNPFTHPQMQSLYTLL